LTVEIKKVDLDLDQKKLLYVINKFTNNSYPDTNPEKSLWIKELSLKIWIFILTKNNIFERYDYAPALSKFGRSRKYSLVSYEGIQDLQYLEDNNLVDKLVISTAEYKNCIAYRISNEGKDYAKTINKNLKDIIDKVLTCPRCGSLFSLKVDKSKLSVIRLCDNCYKKTVSILDGVPQEYVGVSENIGFFDIENIPYESEPYSPKRL